MANNPTLGSEYEINVPAYFALELNKRKDVEDFRLRSNVEGFGNLDDILIDVKLKDGEELHWGFQLKHKQDDKFTISPKDLEGKKETQYQLEKYCKAFTGLKEKNKKYHFILYTNAKFDHASTKAVATFDMMTDDRCKGKPYFATNSDFENIYKFEVNKNTKDGKVVKKEEFEEFFSKFTLYTCQDDFSGFKSKITEHFKNEDLALKYVEFFRNWHQGAFTDKIMDKKTLNINLFDMMISPFIIETQRLSIVSRKRLKLFEAAVGQFDISVVNDSKDKFTIKDFEESEIPQSLKEAMLDLKEAILENTEQLKIDMRMYRNGTHTEESIENPDTTMVRLELHFRLAQKLNEEVQPEEQLKLFQFFFQKPLVVGCGNTGFIYGVAGSFQAKQNIISLPSQQHPILKNLENLQNAKGQLYEEVIKTYRASFYKYLNDSIRDHTKQLKKYMKMYKNETDTEESFNNPHTAMVRLAQHFKLVEKSKEALHPEEKLKLFHYFFQTPVIVDFDEKSKQFIYKAVKSCHLKENKIKLVVVGEGIDTAKFANHAIFKNLNNLQEANRKLYEEMIAKFEVSLQGRKKIFLGDLIGSCEKIGKFMETKYLLKILNGDHQFGEDQAVLPETYIPRTVSSIRFAIGTVLNHVLRHHTEKLIISCEGRFKLIEEQILNKKREFLEIDEYPNESLSNHNIFISKNRKCTSTDFYQVCLQNKSCDVHLVKIVDGTTFLLLMSSNNTLKRLRAYKSECHSIPEDQMYDHFAGPVNVICAQPGMGKSTMLSYLRNSWDSEYWTVQVELNLHNSLLKKKPQSQEMLDIFLKLKDNDADAFTQRLKKIFLDTKKIVMFLDGFDEIEPKCADHVLSFVNELASKGFHVWLSSRHNLKEKLEDNLNVCSIGIDELTEDEQKHYIVYRLHEKYNIHEISKIITKVFTDTHVTRNRQVLGLMQQLYMITQTFLDDRRSYENMNKDTFVLSKLYKSFFQKKYEFLNKKRGLEHPHLHPFQLEDGLENYEIAALQTCLSGETFEKLNLNSRRIRRLVDGFKVKGDPLGIMVKLSDDNKPVFEHPTFAEYFAAFFLSNNFKIARLLRDELFSGDHQNLMLILNIILAEDCPLHLAVIYRSFEETDKYLDHSDNLTVLDKGNRNVLHLACGGGVRCATLKRDINNKITFESVNAIKEESSTYEAIIIRLFQAIDPKDKDELFRYDSLDYSISARCLFPIEVLLETHIPDQLDYDNYYDDVETAFYSSRLCYTNLLSRVLNDSIIKETNKIEPLLNLAMRNTNNKNTVKTITLLLDKGADVNLKGRDGNTPLNIALKQTNHEAAMLLMQKGAKVSLVNDKHETMLHLATRTNNIALIQLFLDENIDVNAQDDKGSTALHVATANGYPDALNLLIENGANVNIISEHGTVLHSAVKKLQVESVRLFLNQNIDVNAQDKNGKTALHVTAEKINYDVLNLRTASGRETAKKIKEIIKLLLDKNIDVNAQDSDGETSLHIFTKKNDSNSVNLLIEKGAQINLISNSGTVLHMAVKSRNIEMMKLYLNMNIDVNAQNKYGTTALHLAVAANNSDAVNLLKEYGANIHLISTKYGTVLHMATETENIEMMKLFLNMNINVNAKDPDKTTALHLAAAHKHSDAVDLLEAYGANINLISKKYGTVLHMVTKSGNIKMMKLFLSMNIDVNAQDRYGRTALDLAIENKHPDAVNLLREYGANINLISTANGTELHMATKNGNIEMMKLFLNMNIDVNAEDQFGKTALHVAVETKHSEAFNVLITNGANINIISAEYGTVLHIAAQSGNVEMIKVLLNMNVDVNAQTRAGITALHLAAVNEHSAAVRLLIQNGASVNLITTSQSPTLHNATVNKNIEIMKLLLNENIDVNAQDGNRSTALDVAINERFSDTVNLLIEKGADINLVNGLHETVLHKAAKSRDIKIMNSLLKTNIDVNAQNSFKQSALHVAAEYGLFEAIAPSGFRLFDDIFPSAAIPDMNQIDKFETLLPSAGKNRTMKLFLKKNIDVNAEDTFGKTALYYAIEKRFFTTVNLLIDNGADINLIQPNDETVLHTAVRSGHIGIIKLFLNKDIDVNAQNRYGRTALYEAIKNRFFDAFNLLIENGADINLTNPEHRTLLHSAAEGGNIEIIQLVLNKNIDVNAQDEHGKTALHLAAENGHSQAVDVLIENGAHIIPISNFGTSLHAAAEDGNIEIMNLYLNMKIDVNAQDQHGRTALHVATQNEQHEALNLLIENGANINLISRSYGSALHIAVNKGNIEMMKLFLKMNIDINAQYKLGTTALHLAAANLYLNRVKLLIDNGANVNLIDEFGTVLHYAAIRAQTEMMKLCLNHSVNVNAQNDDGTTALMVAAENNYPDSVNLLIENGANINLISSKHGTVLHGAVESENIEMMKLFLNMNIDVNAQTEAGKGKTALHLAAERGHIEAVNLLIENHADAALISPLYGTVLHGAASTAKIEVMELLLKMNIDINAQDEDGRTALHLAADNEHFKAATLLIENDANINLISACYGTALHRAAEKGSIEMMKLFLKSNIEVNAQNRDGTTALHLAADKKHSDAVNVLIESGFSVNLISTKHGTVLHRAAENENIEMMKLFLDMKVDVNAQDGCGRTAMHLAAERRPEPSKELDFFKAVFQRVHNPNDKTEEKKSNAVKLLIEIGADIHVISPLYGTVLHRATRSENTEIMKLFLNMNIDVNAQDRNGTTALHLAVANKHSDAVTLLKEYGANFHLISTEYGTVLHIAAKSGDIKMMKLFLDMNIEVNAQDKYGRTALHLAVENKHFDATNLLIDNDANISLNNTCYSNVLNCAASSGSIEMIKLFLNMNIDVNEQDLDGTTALHVAAQYRNSDMAKFLLDEGANIELNENNNRNALHYAIYSGSVAIVRLLLDKGLNLDKIDVSIREYPLRFAVRNEHLENNLLLEMTQVIQNYPGQWKSSSEIVSYLEEHPLY